MTQSEDAEQNRLSKTEIFNMAVHVPQSSTACWCFLWNQKKKNNLESCDSCRARDGKLLYAEFEADRWEVVKILANRLMFLQMNKKKSENVLVGNATNTF